MILAARHLVLLGALACSTVWAEDRLKVETSVDLRWVYSDADRSELRGGIGKLRFDSDSQGLRLGRAMLAGTLRVTDIVSLHAVADAYDDGGASAVDCSEFYLDVRPFPTSAVRWRARLGAFYPPTSLENRGVGWTSVYTITPSAVNTWIGEEFRIIGTELEARWLGASQGYFGDVALVAAAYGWNDPAGTLVADRGFGLSDRPSTLSGSLGRSGYGFFHDIDHKPGYYGGISWRHGERFELRALRYDNRGDPGAFNRDGDGAWRTRFSSLGARFEATERLSFVAQWVGGDTVVGADASGEDQFSLNLHAAFLLASYEWGAQRVTARFDHFGTHQTSGFYGQPVDDDGHAWTLGWSRSLGDNWRLAAEWLRVDSVFPPRLDVPEAAARSDREVQLSLRYRSRFGL